MFEDLTTEARAAEVLFPRAQSPHCTIVLLEGDSDVRLFEYLLDVDISNLVNCFGKENVFRTVQQVEQAKIAGVLAIVDADFTRILNTPTASPNVVLSDFHDFEVVLLNSQAFERLLAEDGSRAKISMLNKPVLETLEDACIPLGCLRLYSHQTGSNLKFKGLNYRHFGRKLQIDIDDAIKEVFDHSNLHKGHKEAKTFIQHIFLSTMDKKQLVCGHDVIAALGVALQSLIGSRRAVHCTVPELKI